MMDVRQFSVRNAIKCGVRGAWDNIFILIKAILTSWAVVIGFGILAILVNFPLMKNLAPLMMEMQKCLTPECMTSINDQMRQMISATNLVLFGSISFLFSIIMMEIMNLGFIKLVLNAYDKTNPRVKDLFSCFDRRLISNFLAGILFALLLACGLILFIIPGLLVMARFVFFTFAIVDKHAGPIEALKMSWNATRGHTLKLMGFMLLISLIALLSYKPQIVLVQLTFTFVQIVAWPIILFIMTCAYRQLMPR